VGELSTTQQMDLFAPLQPRPNHGIDQVVDRIREKFGTLAVVRANVLREWE